MVCLTAVFVSGLFLDLKNAQQLAAFSRCCSSPNACRLPFLLQACLQLLITQFPCCHACSSEELKGPSPTCLPTPTSCTFWGHLNPLNSALHANCTPLQALSCMNGSPNVCCSACTDRSLPSANGRARV